MSIRPAAIALLLGTLLVLGCPRQGGGTAGGVGPTLPPIPAGDWFPLAEGMRWKYQVVTQGGTIQGLMIMTVGKVSRSGATTTAEGVRQLELKFSDERRHNATAAVKWRKMAGGVFETIEGEGGERQVLALPPKFGGRWSFGSIAMEVAQLEDHDAQGTTYKDALKVRAFQGDQLGYAFFARDVGLVTWWGRRLAVGGETAVGFSLMEHVKKGAPLPTPAPSGSPAPSASPTASGSPAPSASPTASPSAAATASPSASPSPSPSATPSPSPSASPS